MAFLSPFNRSGIVLNATRVLLLVAATAAFVKAAGPDRPFVPVPLVELREVWGGACLDCYSSSGECLPDVCVKLQGGGSRRTVGTKITGFACLKVAGGLAGSDGCVTSSPMPCANRYICSDDACSKGCGVAEELSPLNTKCTLGGTTCIGPGG